MYITIGIHVQALCLDKTRQKIINHHFVYKNTFYILMKTDNSLFCHRDIPTIHNGYCVSNAVDYAKKNNVLPTILSTFSLEGVNNNRFFH